MAHPVAEYRAENLWLKEKLKELEKEIAALKPPPRKSTGQPLPSPPPPEYPPFKAETDAEYAARVKQTNDRIKENDRNEFRRQREGLPSTWFYSDGVLYRPWREGDATVEFNGQVHGVMPRVTPEELAARQQMIKAGQSARQPHELFGERAGQARRFTLDDREES